MMAKYPLICITHQSFLLLQDIEQKREYILIIDESLDSLYVKLQVTTYHDNDLVKIFWDKHFKVIPNPEFSNYLANPVISGNKVSYNNTAFAQLVVEDSSKDEICFNSRQYQQITSDNYTWYISPDDYNIMLTGQKESFNLFGIVKAQIMTGWQNIFIAAAAFQYTKMAHWLSRHNLPTETMADCGFNQHDNQVTIHYGDMDIWSLTKQGSQKYFVDGYERQIDDYCDNVIQKHSFIALRNKNKAKGKLNEFVLEHNVHGINSPALADCRHVVIQSALNLDKQFESFLRTCFLVGVPDYLQKETIALMHSVNLFYQVIMRSALRNGDSCDIFVMDRRVAKLLQHYFSNADLLIRPLEVLSGILNPLVLKEATDAFWVLR
jgi:hypothetical protein